MAGMLMSKFRGCLLGATIGDCFGRPFEFQENHDNQVFELFRNSSADKLLKESLPYTDDTVMMRCIAESFIDKKKFDSKDLANRFTEAYFRDPSESRGFGANVVKIFEAWKSGLDADEFGPARRQFNGIGSRGNGGAMRVAPVALISANSSIEQVIQLAKSTALLTHYNWEGYNGAILQALAVWKALQVEPIEEVDADQFMSSLYMEINRIERNNINSEGMTPFSDKISIVKELLERPGVSILEIRENLGNAVTAVGSVPTAIYCFLRALKPIEFLNDQQNAFQRAIMLAILLGGDTDTIACMAGAISGAYFGLQSIPLYLLKPCETNEINSLAESLYNSQQHFIHE